MNRISEIIVGLILCFGSLHAQDVLLPERLIERAPAYSDWVEAIQPKKTESSNPVSPVVTSARILKEMTVTKADSTRREVNLWSDGQRSERWFYNGLVLFQLPGRTGIYILNSFQLDNMPLKGALDISQTDFPKLGWISKEAFKGMKTLNNKSCCYFETKIPAPGAVVKLGEAVETVTLKAWIDSDTKLPVSSDDGTSITTYSFREIPQIPLELPSQFVKALEAYK